MALVGSWRVNQSLGYGRRHCAASTGSQPAGSVTNPGLAGFAEPAQLSLSWLTHLDLEPAFATAAVPASRRTETSPTATVRHLNDVMRISLLAI